MIYYFAHPYSGNEQDNYDLALIRCNRLLDLGYTVICPIIHSHPLDILKTRTYDFWMEQDKEIMTMCKGIILAPGWETSEGCKKEKYLFEINGKEVLYFDTMSKRYKAEHYQTR